MNINELSVGISRFLRFKEKNSARENLILWAATALLAT